MLLSSFLINFSLRRFIDSFIFPAIPFPSPPPKSLLQFLRPPPPSNPPPSSSIGLFPVPESPYNPLPLLCPAPFSYLAPVPLQCLWGAGGIDVLREAPARPPGGPAGSSSQRHPGGGGAGTGRPEPRERRVTGLFNPGGR